MARWTTDDIAQAIDSGRLVELDRTEGAEPTALAFGRSLRIGLAMKGGVSLAVWIGGAVAELDILRRIRVLGTRAAPRPYLLIDPGGATESLVRDRARVYAAALISRGYDQVEFDVLAGASAGGLNGVLYGVAQRQGVAIEPLIEVWMESGDIWALLREPGFRATESALGGDETFWPAARAAIEQLYATPGNDDHRARRIVVDLSSTVVDHDDVRRVGMNERSGHFHFVGENAVGALEPGAEKGRAIPSLPQPVAQSDLPAGTSSPASPRMTPADAASVARLAYAARSTSSFPGAFEPALVWSPNTLDDETLASNTQLDMRFAFHLQRGRIEDQPRPFRIIDGGVTDNVPIDRAYRAIRDTLADRFGDRALIYLEPDPKTLGRTLTPSGTVPAPDPANPATRRSDTVSGFIRTIRAGVSGRGIRESADDEIDELEEYRRQLYLEQGRDESYAVTADAAEGSYSKPHARAAYVRYRSTSDLGTLNRVLCNPSLWQLGTDLTSRVPREPASAAFLAGLDSSLIRTYQQIATTTDGRFHTIGSGSQALADATRSAVAWLRKLEAIAFDSHEALQRQLLGDQFALIRAKLTPVARTARRVRDLSLDRLQLEIMGIESASAIPESASQSVVDEWLTSETTAAADSEVVSAWESLNDCVTRLRAVTGSLRERADELASADPPDTDLKDQLDQTPWSAVPALDDDFTAADLAPFAASRGIPEPISTIRFARITGSERPSAELKFPSLREAQLALTVESWLALDADEFDPAAVQANVPSALDANAKLAGSALFNFGAFLSRDWRRNDWWWGRMDAAAGILRFLDTLAARDDRGFGLDDSITATQSKILVQAGTDVAPLASTPTEPVSVSTAMSAGAHTLSNLRPGYLVAIASRGVRIVGRAIARGVGFTQFLARVFAPPLLVAVPIIAHPIRALVAAVLVFATLAAAASPIYGLARLVPGLGIEVPPPAAAPPVAPVAPGVPAEAWYQSSALWLWIVLIAAALGGLAIAGVAAWNRSRERWAKLDTATPSTAGPQPLVDPGTAGRSLTGILRARRDRAVRAAWLAAVGGLALILLAGVFVYADQGLSIRVWALVAGAIGCGLVVRSRSRRLPPESRHDKARGFWIGLLVVAAILALLPEYTWMAINRLETWAFTPWLPEGVTVHQSLALALCAGLLAIVLGWGWLGATAKPGGRIAVLWILLVAVICALAVLGVAGIVEATFPAANSVIPKGVAVTITAWFVAAWVFWYAGELRFYMKYPASDSAEFEKPPA